MDSKTNYKAIYKALKEEIQKEVFPAGSLLPTESVMAERYAVSRPTIAKAYNQLQEEGYIKKKQGLGTIVTYNSSGPSSYTFGLLLPGAGESEIFSIINDRFLRQSENGQFNCLWEGATASSADIRKTLIEACCESYIHKKVDGIFFSPLERVPDADTLNRKICRRIKEAGIPIVLIDRDILAFPGRSDFDLVSLDNFHAGYVMAEHLLEQGCQTVHYFFRPDSANSVALRRMGVKTAVEEHQYTFNETNVYCGNPDDMAFVQTIRIVPGKTGIVCANDSTAAVLMSSLDRAGIKISTDIVICAYDNMKYSSHLKHALTSYKQPCEEIADASIELMMRRVKEKGVFPVTVHLSGEIIVRDSSKFSNV